MILAEIEMPTCIFILPVIKVHSTSSTARFTFMMCFIVLPSVEYEGVYSNMHPKPDERIEARAITPHLICNSVSDKIFRLQQAQISLKYDSLHCRVILNA